MIPDDYYYQHLTPKAFDIKEDILSISKDIENSFTGRLDVMGLHIFFSEASSLINNAVRQYEQGFFDSAFYSVRSALELARIVAYFSHQDEPTESDIYKKWVQGGKFPYDSQIRGLLNDTSAVYVEVREALSDFFDAQDERLKQVQKYIHKQGYRTFYHQNAFRPDIKKFRAEQVDKLFSEFITNSTIEIAFLRLCIDPFPVLLQDPSVMYKIHFQSVTEPYHDKTLELMGEQNLAKYRKTDFYSSHVDFYATNEELDEATYEIVNHQFYDKTSEEKIKKQLHLLSNDAVLAISIFDVSEDITKVYMQGGWIWYFTNADSVRKNWGFSSESLNRLVEAKTQVNTEYDEAFLSYFSSNKTQCWTEQNSKLSNEQIEVIRKLVEEADKKETAL